MGVSYVFPRTFIFSLGVRAPGGERSQPREAIGETASKAPRESSRLSLKGSDWLSSKAPSLVSQ